MGMDKEKLTNIYAATTDEPTDREVEWVIENFSEKDAPVLAVIPGGSPEVYCECYEDVYVLEVMLDEEATDVPRGEWQFEDGRQLKVLVCEKCGSWALCD